MSVATTSLFLVAAGSEGLVLLVMHSPVRREGAAYRGIHYASFFCSRISSLESERERSKSGSRITAAEAGCPSVRRDAVCIPGLCRRRRPDEGLALRSSRETLQKSLLPPLSAPPPPSLSRSAFPYASVLYGKPEKAVCFHAIVCLQSIIFIDYKHLHSEA